jgi:histidyl-tRNA synthetase
MDRDASTRSAGYQNMVQTLRGAGIRAELFQGNPKQFGKQLQYADRRGSAVAVIQGGDERADDQVTLKDLIAGREAAKDIADRADWVEQRPAQVTVPEADLVAEVKKILAQYEG